ncbi:SusD/RagB family nutrient-binding outer membrane lipoprotein [Marinilongibacter aquaticus]|uniref:SusD/RagB family nutrient-binding outer membrane lipoprotein n=1 Tax=Marinilongibacter aquaticus TaxID=2975157 RepID=UPI0021BCFE5A|nr:SusD/RagB family nutrient-binding outer membrane lipoprotein [Marinilongibacter aquaticus]UBM57339.1 SusD/RagB family nutrient-binding outer membrane lipoprotein [Marinilongibacter aquaticus]
MKILKYSLILTSFLLFSSCDKGFDEMNVNKTAVTSIDPAFILNQAIISSSFVTTAAIYDMGVVQQLVTPNSGFIAGANFNIDNRLRTQEPWQNYYQNVIRNTTDVIEKTSGDAERNNLLQMARIVQAFTFMILTDEYGEIPYFEGGKGYLEQLVRPKYDAQEDIYKDLINELKEATAALNASGKIESVDVMYNGDVEKWRKFGNAVLLRAGMHLTEVDPALAQSTVQAALSGGLMSSNADNFVIRHDPNYLNPIGNMLNATEANNFYLTDVFVDALKSKSDPRLQSIAVRYVGADSGPQQTADRGVTDPEMQVGMPLGYDNNGIETVADEAGLKSFYAYSQIDRNRMVRTFAPVFLVTYGQSQLLLAEAAVRGWVSGDAAEYYRNGIEAHMFQMEEYNENSAIAAADIEAYLDAHPLGQNQLAEIGEQYWIASFLNGPEAFANFRRTGFPQLAPNPYPGKDISGDFINRLTYPNSEISVNSDNVKAAIARQGDDNLDTKVWWDK